jgi:hypothetical protein
VVVDRKPFVYRLIVELKYCSYCRYKFVILVSEGPVLNVTTATQYTSSGAPFILDKVQEGTIYSFAVMLETADGYRSTMSEVSSVEMPVGKYEVLDMFLLSEWMNK